MNPWLGLAVLLAAQLLWLLFTRLLAARGVEAEWTRKIFHAGQGTLLLAMPLLLGGALEPLLVWALLGIGAMSALLLSPELRSKAAGNVYDVSRVSYGDLYFVIGVALLYFFGASTYYTYAVPLTMLAYADAVSALVGKRFGRHKFEAAEGRKSIEGSLSFFAVAFVATLAWAPALPQADWTQLLLIAVSLGLVTMLLEAISWRGLDNLLIPLGGFLLLRTYLMLTPALLAVNLGVLTLLVVFSIAWRRRSTLSHSALIVGALFGYSAWTVAGALWDGGVGPLGVLWLAPPLLLFLLFNLLVAPQLLEEHHRRHSVDSVLASIFGGALWLALAVQLGRPEFIFPYAASFAAIAFNVYLEREIGPRRTPRAFRGLLAGGTALLLLGYGALYLLDAEQTTRLALALLLAALGAVATTLLLRWAVNAALADATEQRWRWHIRALVALAGSLVAALPVAVWSITPG